MNLREKIEKDITEKVMIKLASERVDLGTIDDLRKLTNESKKLIKEIETFETKIKSERKILFKTVNDYNSMSNKLDEIEKQKSPLSKRMGTLIDEIRKTSKDLGLNPNTIDGMKEVYNVKEQMTRRSAVGGKADLTFEG